MKKKYILLYIPLIIIGIVVLYEVLRFISFAIEYYSAKDLVIVDNLPNTPDGIGPSDTIVYYNGHVYDKIYNWIPIEKVTRKDKGWLDAIIRFPKTGTIKTNTNIGLYNNDPNELFLVANYKSWFVEEQRYHKRGDELPKPYSKDAEIILKSEALKSKSYKSITLKNDLALEFKTFIRRCLSGSIVGRKEMPTYNEKISNTYGIEVHFEDYPAYNYFAYFWYTNNEILMWPLTSSNKSKYFVLTGELAQKIIQLIKDK